MKLDYAMMGNRIRMQRRRCGLTQEQLAEQIERAASYIGHIERGTRRMSLETLCAISEALKCSTDRLLGLVPGPLDQLAGARELLALANRLAEEWDSE